MGGDAEVKQQEATAFRDVKCLLLSYQNILKIDNLVGFDRVVKLQLDNNIIEKIEHLGHLTSLEVCRTLSSRRFSVLWHSRLIHLRH